MKAVASLLDSIKLAARLSNNFAEFELAQIWRRLPGLVFHLSPEPRPLRAKTPHARAMSAAAPARLPQGLRAWRFRTRYG